MLKPILASLFLAASATAVAQAPATAQWALANTADGCMVHASAGQGTVLSISGMPGEEALLFVIQNHQLAGLSDGQQYGIEVEFDDLGEWQIPALAQMRIDSDGPGLIFAIRPGRADGANFIKEFSSASGMRIGREEARLDSLAIGGGNGAMSALATCLSEKWAGAAGAGGQGGPLIEVEEEEAETPIPL